VARALRASHIDSTPEAWKGAMILIRHARFHCSGNRSAPSASGTRRDPGALITRSVRG